MDVRIISSTSRDLERDIERGPLPRGPLSPASNVVPLRVPGLAERREDIPEAHPVFRQSAFASASGLAPRRIGEDAIAVLQAHDWPGNVRKLRNNIERLMILAGGDPSAVITADMLPEGDRLQRAASPVNGGAEHLMSAAASRGARDLRARVSPGCRSTALAATSRARPEFVGMERSALHRKLRALGVSSDQRAGEVKTA